MDNLLKRRSALFSVYTVGITGSGKGLSITERHPLTMFDIGGSPKGAIAGCPVPATPNTVTADGTSRLMWLSPKRWLLVDADPDLTIDTEIMRNVSSGRTVLRLHGENVRDVLAKGCPLDLHPQSFKPGTCAQSRIGSLNVLIDHIEDKTFDIYIARGFAVTFWEWLTEAACEYGYEVLPVSLN